MAVKYPQKQDLIRFVYHTNVVEGLKVTRADVEEMYRPDRKDLNPFVVGMFDAINYGLRTLLTNNPDFPCKEVSLVTNLYRSHDALGWLRELHSRICSPLAKAALTDRWAGEIAVRAGDCGSYRSYDLPLAFTMAPPPHLVEPLLHNWLVDTAEFHDRVKDRVDSPYGLDAKTAGELVTRADGACLFLSNLQPFTYGNNRLGWLVANLFRLLWRLPWRDLPGYGDNTDRDYKAWINEMTNFQSQEMPKLLKKAEVMIAS